ncbi:YveK family protein [Kineococcus sp. SYSU DK005]|uniref:YveK family protein n=1 Tax=Kineococcus sp. SYSU DK005 TaxID=3383126 RepID=UPI003D7D61B5
MSIGEFLHALRRRRRLVAVSFLVPLLLAVVATALLPRTYEATATVFVSTPGNPQDPELAFEGSGFAQDRAESYALLARTRTVTAPVVQSTGSSESPEELASRISTSVPLDTVVLELTVADGSAARAAELADAVARQLVTTVGELESAGGVPSPVALTLVQPATAPSSPASPSWALGLALGVLAGLALAVCAALVAESASAASRRSVHLDATAPGAPRSGGQELAGAGARHAD